MPRELGDSYIGIREWAFTSLFLSSSWDLGCREPINSDMLSSLSDEALDFQIFVTQV